MHSPSGISSTPLPAIFTCRLLSWALASMSPVLSAGPLSLVFLTCEKDTGTGHHLGHPHSSGVWRMRPGRLPYSLDRLGNAGTLKVNSHQVVLSSHCVCRVEATGRDVGCPSQGLLPMQEGSLRILVTVAASLVYIVLE